MLILAFGIQLAYASRNANTQFRVSSVNEAFRMSSSNSFHFHFCLNLLKTFLNLFYFFPSFDSSGKTISRHSDRHRVCRFIQLLHNTRLVLVGIQSNNVVLGPVYTVATYAKSGVVPHLSAKNLLSKQAGMLRNFNNRCQS